MRVPSSLASHLGLVAGALCGVAGLALSGVEAALLWFVVGYFLGKALQSTLWTFTRDPTA